MSCEHYKDALIETAASGSAPSGALRAHLAECDSCRAAFDEEQSLFAAIDSGLHTTANSEVPPSLLPRVRARLEEVGIAPLLRWVQPFIFSSAGVALAFVIFLMARPHHATIENVAKQSPAIPTPMVPATNKNPGKNSPADTQTTSVRSTRSKAGRNSTIVHLVASSNPEVLVPPDEREAFARFVAVLGERREVARALVTPNPQTKDGLVGLKPLQINGLEIKLLAETEAEQSDGAEQEQ
jgi:hypothetical protein